MALIPTPKQFVPLIQGKSLLRLTAERLKPLLRASVTNPITLLPLLSIAS
jgi:mannose-1-phosphate guanylyltransferase